MSTTQIDGRSVGTPRSERRPKPHAVDRALAEAIAHMAVRYHAEGTSGGSYDTATRTFGNGKPSPGKAIRRRALGESGRQPYWSARTVPLDLAGAGRPKRDDICS